MGMLYVLFLFGSLVIYAGPSPQQNVTQFIVAKTVGSIFWVSFLADVVSPSFYSVILPNSMLTTASF